MGYAEAGYAGAMSIAADTRVEHFVPLDIAVMHLCAGENGQALEWMEKGFETRDPNIPYIGVFPMYDDLRAEPRYQNLLRRLNLPQYQPVSGRN